MRHIYKLLVALLILADVDAYAQCPENIGFEDGTLTNWRAASGDVLPDGKIDVSSSAPNSARHVIMRASDMKTDEFGKFPTVSPNGSKYSVRLGNSRVNHQAERLSYILTVPNVQQYSLVLSYAVVLQNPADHGAFEQPRFTVNVYNITDNEPVQCPAFDFIAASNLPGFFVSSVGSVYCKDWSATTIDLSAYAGKQIRLEFTTNDCARNGHFGYAYFDLSEECKQAITGNTYCAGQTAVTLSGPRGFSNYTWYNADMSEEIGHEQTLKLDPAPPDGTQFVLAVSALPGLGCTGIINTTIFKSGAPFVFKLKDEQIKICPGTSVDLTAPGITEGSSPGLDFEYYKSPITLEYLRNPEKISEPGTYYIQATNAEGCVNILAVNVLLYDEADITVNNPTVQYPATIDLSSTFDKTPDYSYFYYTDAKATIPVNDYRSVKVAGKYFIKAVNPTGCEKVMPVVVTIMPPPPYLISGSTAFTPNNDGINDLFSITINGFVDFGMLNIYNRNGQIVFKANQQSNSWDGNLGGRSLPAGTYYWLFEGVDQYYHTKVSKTGYVSIIK